MGSGIFYSNKANTKKNVKKSTFRRMFFAGIVLLFTLPFQGKAQTPVFVSGATQNIAMCVNTVNFDIDSLIGTIDALGNTDTWTFGTLPTHGSLVGGIADFGFYSQLNTINPNTPPDGNAMYNPFGGYVGSDTFSIVVSNGVNSATLIFYVNVLGVPSLTLGAFPAVCAGVTSAAIPFTLTGGVGPVTINFDPTGSVQTFNVPAGITSIMFDAGGGNGGSDNVSGTPNPGLGGRIQGTLNVAPGALLNIYVGTKGFDGSAFGAAGGYNGGGNAFNYPGIGCGGAGGGASDIRLTGNALTDRVVVAGGGGGNGYDSPFGAYAGGDGGGLSGANSMANIGGSSALGGTQAGGGAHANFPGWLPGSNGVAGVGGDGSIEGVSGGGGGGFFGGGGGVWNGGGGGSSFADPAQTTLVTNTQGINIGDGYVALTYINAGTYNISWDGPAGTAGFTNVTNASLPVGAFPITIPSSAPASIYTATLTVTNGVCSTDYMIQVTVNPIPVIDLTSIPTSYALCNGMATTAVTPTDDVGGSLSWTNDNTSIGLAASGSGVTRNIATFPAENTTTVQQVANITYTDTALGCVGVPATFTITVNPTPMLTSTVAGTSCSYALFTFTAAATTGPTTNLQWSRAAMPGLSSGTNSNFGNISETLTDTFSAPITVPYVYTLTTAAPANCTNTQTISLTLYPPALLTSDKIAGDICSGDTFKYHPTAITDTLTTTTYAWTRDSVAGVTSPANTGTGDVVEPITNILPNAQTVGYVYYATAYGCTFPNLIQVNVNPIPVLSSTLMPPPVCFGDSFLYHATSATTNVSFQWNRGAIYGVSDASRTQSGDVSDLLHDTTANAVVVPYQYTVTGITSGCNSTEIVSVDIRPNPILNSAHTDMVCSGAPYNYMASSATSGTTFSWSRGTVPGISNGVGLGSGNIRDSLVNTTDSQVVVKYNYTINDSGCFNNDSVWVTVNPTPVITSSLRDTALCDSTMYTYTPTSSTKGVAFTWSRVYVGGIYNAPATGTGAFHEELVNTTNVDATATYVYSVTANGCPGTPVDLHVKIHPTPKITGDHNFITCSGANFNYSAQSNVLGTTYQWNRPYVLGIYPVNRFGTGDVLDDVLLDSVYIPLTTIYYYRLSANGCTNIYPEQIVVKVNPAPDLRPGIQTLASNTPCSNTTFQTFGAPTAPPAGEHYSWSAVNGNVWATSPNEQFAYVNFFTPGAGDVILTGLIEATGCIGLVDFHVNVGSGVSDNPQVIYFQSQFICLENDEDSYQWGYDDAVTFAPTVLPGANAQNYYDPGADFTHNRYWVITQHNGCTSKTYYNQPTGVGNVNAIAGEMKVYPNPAGAEVNVAVNTTATGEMQVEVLNMLGQKITIVPTVNKQAKINVADLPSGCYLVECYREDVKIATARFIKN